MIKYTENYFNSKKYFNLNVSIYGYEYIYRNTNRYNTINV